MQTTTKVFVLAVRKDFPANTYEEYIAYARANPGKVTWSTVGAGGALHMTGEWLAAGTGAKLSFIHYKGGAQAEVDLLAGRIDSSPKGAVTALPQLKAGKLRVLAIITGQRTNLFPGIRTVAERSPEEFGIPNFSYPSWVGVLAPGATPPAIVEKLNADFGKAIHSPKAAQAFQKLDSVVIGSSADGFRQMLAREVAHWKKLVKDNNITIQ
jgi:tripartite-type tricarboxylate transporter receptor subunit TctC